MQCLLSGKHLQYGIVCLTTCIFWYTKSSQELWHRASGRDPFRSSEGESHPYPPHLFQYSSSARGLRGLSAVKCFISLFGTWRWQQPWHWRDCMTVTKKAWVIFRELASALQLAPGPSSEGHTADISSCESPPDTAWVQHNSCGLAALREVLSPCLLPRVNVALQNTWHSKATKRQMATWPSC